MTSPIVRVGVDTGGTFTDVVGDDGRVAKVPSTPGRPSDAVRGGVAALDAQSLALLAHGTTVATNALLERSAAPVALVASAGFADVIEIGRQDRPALYDQFADRPEPLVPRHLRFEVGGRLDASGGELEPIDLGGLTAIPPTVPSVAVCLLHADLSTDHERAVASALRDRGFDVCLSSDVSPEFREYERTVTTVVNAYLRPPCRGYLHDLAGTAAEVLVMNSAGGLLPLDQAADFPAALLLSGPAGGAQAAAAEAVAAGFPDAVTLDMGGTSTDVCLIRAGVAAAAPQRGVGGLPIRLPGLDIHTIGAGGGSIAAIDAGGALIVGPRSAGARPGPACYGLGGDEPTVTDADLVAGRMPDGITLPGLGALDRSAAEQALLRAGITAEGVIAVVDAAMVQAVRAVTVERGVDPRRLALVAFGGAGPMHACAIADALGMRAVVIPTRAGVLSAVGLLCASRQVDLVRSWPQPGSLSGVESALEGLAAEAARAAGADQDVIVEVAVDCRFAGQSHELTVPTVSAFEAEHRARSGYARPDTPVEVVALRARARRRATVDQHRLPPPPGRQPAGGGCVLAESDCTVWIPEEWRADVSDSGSWVLTRRRDGRRDGRRDDGP